MLAPEKCFTTMSSLHFAAFQMVCTYLFFNIESPKITVVRVLFLCFCTTFLFPCPCWSQNCYYQQGHFCLDHDRFWGVFFDVVLQYFKTVL